MDAAADGSFDTFLRNALACGLYGIAARHPERRGDVAAFVTRLLREGDEELVSLLVDDAARIDHPEVQAAIDTAFDEGRVFERAKPSAPPRPSGRVARRRGPGSGETSRARVAAESTHRGAALRERGSEGGALLLALAPGAAERARARCA